MNTNKVHIKTVRENGSSLYVTKEQGAITYEIGKTYEAPSEDKPLFVGEPLESCYYCSLHEAWYTRPEWKSCEVMPQRLLLVMCEAQESCIEICRVNDCKIDPKHTRHVCRFTTQKLTVIGEVFVPQSMK